MIGKMFDFWLTPSESCLINKFKVLTHLIQTQDDMSHNSLPNNSCYPTVTMD